MEMTPIDAGEEEDEEPQCSLNTDISVAEHYISEITPNKFKRLLGVQAEKEPPSDSGQQLVGKRCTQGSFLQGVLATELRIPKYMRFASLNENYLQYCVDLVELRAANSLSLVCSPGPCIISKRLTSPDKDVLFDNKLESCRHLKRNTSDMCHIIIQSPSSARNGQWVVSTIDRNRSVGNILNDPLLNHLGTFDSVMDIGRVGLIDRTKNTSSLSFSSEPSITTPLKLATESVVGNLKYGSKALTKRFSFMSSAKSTGSYQGSATSRATLSQGMLHCKWEDRNLCLMYSVDGQKEVYVAKVEQSDYKDLDCMYSFYAKKGGRKARETCGNSLDDLVGKMTVSDSLTLSSDSDNSKLIETEFVMFAADANQIENTASSDHILEKIKVYPNKVVDVFRPKHLIKNKSSLKFGAQSNIPNDHFLDLSESNKLNKQRSEKFLGGPPNLELAAIVVKEQVQDNHRKKEVGGWGLKFLEKVQVERANSSLEASISSRNFQDSHPTNTSESSTNITVIFPAGIHGGPRTRNGGPSSLTKRWRSGGQCDCGGWDIGCPLSIVNNQSSKEASIASSEVESKSLNLVIQGIEQDVPSLKMVHIDDDIYQIQFHPSLSALQSFSVGVAVIHTRFHSRISNMYRTKGSKNVA